MTMFGHRKGSEWFRHFFGVPGGYRNPPGEVMGLMGHKKEAHQPTKGWCPPLGSRPNWNRFGGAPPPVVAPSLSPIGPLRPITSWGGGPVTLRHSGFIGNYPEHFRCPNNMVQYINLYVSTILRLLVMSVISSGTPNNLRYIKSHKLIIPIDTKR